jgi:hypothetical protein
VSGLVSIIPANCEIHNRTGWWGKNSNPMQPEVREMPFFEGVSVFDPSVYIDSFSATGYVRYLPGTQSPIEPQSLIKGCSSAQSIGELLLQSRNSQRILISGRDYGNLNPANYVVGRSLARIFYQHRRTRNKGSRWLRRIHHAAVYEREIFWQYIRSQLSLRAMADCPPCEERDEDVNRSNAANDPFSMSHKWLGFYLDLLLCGLGCICFIRGADIDLDGGGRWLWGAWLIAGLPPFIVGLDLS